METVDLTDIERRPQRYWNMDGLPELMMGVLWIVWGGAWLLGERIPRGGVYNAFWMFVPALLALSGFAVVWATRALKARITFPRAGYVAWQPPTRSARLGAAAVTQHAPHYLALAGVAVALGIALGARGAGWESANWLFVLIGAASAVVGAARLALFLRSHPRPVESA